MTLIRSSYRSSAVLVHRSEAPTVRARPSVMRRPDAFLPKRVPGSPDTPPQTPDYTQGDGSNSCGTTALCVALLRLGHSSVSRATMDRAIRNGDIFTAPEELVSLARELGFDASLRNHGSFEQLQADLAKGRQAIALINVGPYDANEDLTKGDGTHYVTMTKAWVDANGEKMVELVTWGRVERMKYSDFEKLWSDVRIGGVSTGFDRMYALVDDPKRAGYSPLPGSNTFEAETALLGANVAANVVNGWEHLKRGRVAVGLSELVGGVVGAAAALPAAVLYFGGQYVERGGKALRELGSQLVRRNGFFQKVAGHGLRFLGSVVETGGKVVKAVANTVAAVGNAVSKGIKAVGKWLSGLF